MVKTKTLSISALSIFGVYSLILFIYRYNNPLFTVKKMVLFFIGGLLVIGGLPLAYWFITRRDNALSKNLKKQLTTLPEPITIEECRIIRDREILESYENYLQSPEIENTPSVGVGLKSSIYICQAEAVYDDPYASEIYHTFFVAINMHYPDKKRAVLKDPTPVEIEKTIARIASNPEGEPDVREIMEENPLLGTKRTIKETTHKKDEAKEPKESEDFEEKKEDEKK